MLRGYCNWINVLNTPGSAPYPPVDFVVSAEVGQGQPCFANFMTTFWMRPPGTPGFEDCERLFAHQKNKETQESRKCCRLAIPWWPNDYLRWRSRIMRSGFQDRMTQRVGCRWVVASGRWVAGGLQVGCRIGGPSGCVVASRMRSGFQVG